MDSTTYGMGYANFNSYVHSWPGKAKVKSSCKHRAARRQRFNARHG